MQQRVGGVTWAFVFFGCAALSAAIGGWKAWGGRLTAHAAPAGWVAAWALLFTAHVAMTLRIAQEARAAGSERLGTLVLLAAGVGLLLVSAAFRLR
jgi:hypothetical protein